MNGGDHRIHIAAGIAAQVDDDAFQRDGFRGFGFRQRVEHGLGIALIFIGRLAAEMRQNDEQDAVVEPRHRRLGCLVLGRRLLLAFHRRDERMLSPGYLERRAGNLISLFLRPWLGLQRRRPRLFPRRTLGEQPVLVHQFDSLPDILLFRTLAPGQHQTDPCGQCEKREIQ